MKVHGFKPNSRAEEQGLIKVNDEILSINSVDVEGQVRKTFSYPTDLGISRLIILLLMIPLNIYLCISSHPSFLGLTSTSKCIGENIYAYRSMWRS